MSDRDPAYRPSARSMRSIAKAEAKRDERGGLVLLASMVLVSSGALIVWLVLWALLRRLSLISVLVALGLAFAGCAADPKKVSALDSEIATLTSLALMEGPRTPYEKKGIAADGDIAKKHLHELTGN